MMNTSFGCDGGYGYESEYCQEVEFGTMSAANSVRHMYFSDCVRPEDDARKKTVVLHTDTPDYCMDEIIRIQRESFEEIEGHKYGQEPLNAFEKSKLDFSERNLFHAMAVKAIASHYGVLDWMAYYDTSLEVGEHIGSYQQTSATGVTMRELPQELMI